jgi:hypothetical protein
MMGYSRDSFYRFKELPGQFDRFMVIRVNWRIHFAATLPDGSKHLSARRLKMRGPL